MFYLIYIGSFTWCRCIMYDTFWYVWNYYYIYTVLCYAAMRNLCFDHVWCLRVGSNYFAKCQHPASLSLHRHCCTLWGTFWRSHGPDRIASHCHGAEWSTGGHLMSFVFFSWCKTCQSLGQPAVADSHGRRCSQHYTHPWLGGNPPGLTKYRSWSIYFDQCLVWSVGEQKAARWKPDGFISCGHASYSDPKSWMLGRWHKTWPRFGLASDLCPGGSSTST